MKIKTKVEKNIDKLSKQLDKDFPNKVFRLLPLKDEIEIVEVKARLKIGAGDTYDEAIYTMLKNVL